MSDHGDLMEILAEDILNTVDGAGSDLRWAFRDDIWIDVDGSIDLSALANTILAAGFVRKENQS
jgi:hypothetical protein